MGELKRKGFINQRDMALTQFGFLGYALSKPAGLGLPANNDHLMEALNHFWRVIGSMLGIEDEFNLCAADYRHTIARCDAILRHVYVPALIRPPPEFETMTKALLDGLGCVNPDIKYDEFMFYTKMVSGVPGFYMDEEGRTLQLDYVRQYPQYLPDPEAMKKELMDTPDECRHLMKFSMWDRMNIRLSIFIVRNLISKWVLCNRLFNGMAHMRLFFLKYFPYMAIYQFGVRDAYVRVLDG